MSLSDLYKHGFVVSYDGVPLAPELVTISYPSQSQLVLVPEGAGAVIASDQLLERYSDWTEVRVPDGYTGRVEVRAYPNPSDPAVWEVAARYADLKPVVPEISQ